MGKIINILYNLIRHGTYAEEVLDRKYVIKDPVTKKVRSRVRIKIIDSNALRYSANEAIQFLTRIGAGDKYTREIGSNRGPINKTHSILEIKIDPTHSSQDKIDLVNILRNP